MTVCAAAQHSVAVDSRAIVCALRARYLIRLQLNLIVSSGQVVFHRGSMLFAAPFSARSHTVTGPAIQLVSDVSTNGFVYDFTVARNGGWLAYQAGSADVPTTMLAVDRRGR